MGLQPPPEAVPASECSDPLRYWRQEVLGPATESLFWEAQAPLLTASRSKAAGPLRLSAKRREPVHASHVLALLSLHRGATDSLLHRFVPQSEASSI
jgi:hypothetical protein